MGIFNEMDKTPHPHCILPYQLRSSHTHLYRLVPLTGTAPKVLRKAPNVSEEGPPRRLLVPLPDELPVIDPLSGPFSGGSKP